LGGLKLAAAIKRISEEGKRVQKSTVAGILSIVVGALGVIVSLLFLVFAVIAPSAYSDNYIVGDVTPYMSDAATIVAVIYGLFGSIGLLVSSLGIVGGIFSIQRKHFGWALAGAIASSMIFYPLGIGAVVLVAMSRSEFVQNAPGIPPQPSVNNPA
jgi:hypothetical protein